MHRSVVASVTIHAAILFWAYAHIMGTPELRPSAPEMIEVSMITPSELLALKKGDVNSTELDAKAKDAPPTEMSKLEAEKPKPVEGPPPAAAPPPPQEEAKPPEPEPPKVEEAKPAEPPKTDPIAEKLAALPPEPAPGPTPEELKKAEEQKQAEEARKADEIRKAEEEKKKAEEKKKEEQKKKAEEKKRKEKEKQKKLAEEKKKKDEEAKKQQPPSEAERLALLLDKTPDKRGAPNAAAPPQTETDYQGPTAGAREGNAARLSVREADLLNSKVASQLRQCWRLPGAGGGIETAVVTVTWRLRQDGSLDGEPTLEGSYTDQVHQIAADAALRAIRTCSPFDLPADKYKFWSKITFDFDPREMTGGPR